MSHMAPGYTKSPAAANKSLASRGTLPVVKDSIVRTPPRCQIDSWLNHIFDMISK